MENLFVVSKAFVNDLIEEVRNGDGFQKYLDMNFEIKPINQIKTSLDLKDFALKIPDGKNNFEFENAVLLYDKLKNLDRTKASDDRLWTVLSHYYFKDYMKARWDVNKYFDKVDSSDVELSKKREQKIDYIFEHYLLKTVSTQSLIRSGISGLWWGAYLTYDEKRGLGKEFDLTKEYFSMLDYSRSLAGGQIGRCRHIVQGVLEFIIENPDVFSKSKEAKVRWIVRCFLNRMGGVKPISALTKGSILEKLHANIEEILKINE